MDQFDRATQIEERDRDLAIARRVKYSGDSAEHCDECMDPIPQPRRDAIPGVRLCISCQQANELRTKTGAL